MNDNEFLDTDYNYDEQPETVPSPAVLRRRRWEKRRKWQQERLSALSLLVLIPVLFLISLFLLVFPRSKVSQIEKRQLAAFPQFTLGSYFSGDFTSGITTFYDDSVPYRDSFKRLGSRFDSVLGLRSSTDSITFINNDIVADNMNGGKQTEPNGTTAPSADPAGSEPDTTGTSTPPETTVPTTPPRDYGAENADFDTTNGLMIVNQDGHWKCLSLFGGGSGNAYVEALNTLQAKVGSGVTIYSMPAPLSSQFYVPSNASGYSADQDACFNSIAERLDSKIVSINICPVLAQHAEEPIYCRTDHHWQSLGAYYACQAFAQAAGVPYADLSKYEKGVNEGYVGTMYAFSGDSRILNDPEDFYFYKPTCSYTTDYYDTSFQYLRSGELFAKVDIANSYLMYMGSDEYTVRVNTSVRNGRRLLLIKDSYGNAEVPFFTSSFEQIYVVDMRYFQRNLVNFIDTMGITDVLFSMCSYSVVGVNADNLMDLITQDAGSTIVDAHPAETQPLVTAPKETSPQS